MKTISQYEVRTLTWAASSPSQLNIGYLDYWVTGIDIQFIWSLSNSTPAAYQDWASRQVASITLVDGGRQYLAINGTPDIRPLYWHVRTRHEGRFRAPDFESASAPLVVQSLPLVFSPEPQIYDDQINWHDPRVGIQPSAGLTMTVNWAGASAGGTGITVQGSGKSFALLTYHGVIPEAGDKAPAFYPQWQTYQYTPPSTAQALQSTYPLNPGPYYRRITQVITKGAQSGGADIRWDGYGLSSGTLDNTSTRANISEVGLVTSDRRNPVYRKLYQAAAGSQSAFQVADDNSYANEYAGATAAYGASVSTARHNPGVVSMDLAKLLKGADPVFGANSAGKAPTSLQLGYSVDSTGNTPNALVLLEAYGAY